MNNQASDDITEAGKDLVLSCIKNPELRDHVRKCTWLISDLSRTH